MVPLVGLLFVCLVSHQGGQFLLMRVLFGLEVVSNEGVVLCTKCGVECFRTTKRQPDSTREAIHIYIFHG